MIIFFQKPIWQFDWFLISFVVQFWSSFSRTWLDVSRTALQYSWGSLCFGALANMALKPIRVVLRFIMLLTKSCGICSQVRRLYKQMLAFRLWHWVICGREEHHGNTTGFFLCFFLETLGTWKLLCHDIMLHLTVSPWPRIVSYGDSAYLAIALEGHGYRVACSEAAEILGNESVQEITWLDDVLLEMQILGSCAISFWVTFAVWICISILPDFKNPYSDRSSTARACCLCSFWSYLFYCLNSSTCHIMICLSVQFYHHFFESFSPFGLLHSIVDSNRDLALWILQQCIAINATTNRNSFPKFEDTWQTKRSCWCQPFWSLNCAFGPLWRA